MNEALMYQMARRAPDVTIVSQATSRGFQQRNVYTNDPESVRIWPMLPTGTGRTTTATSYYRAPPMMNGQHAAPNYIASVSMPPVSYGPQPVPHESRVDRAYVTSFRGLLKFACLVFSFIAFMCVVATTNCNGNHVFLGTVTWLVMTMQVLIIIAFLFRLRNRFTGIDFEFLDFFATAHDALYLLIASSVTIHYCRMPGQIAGGVMGIFAFLCLAGDAVVIFLARREEPASSSHGTR